MLRQRIRWVSQDFPILGGLVLVQNFGPIDTKFGEVQYWSQEDRFWRF